LWAENGRNRAEFQELPTFSATRPLPAKLGARCKAATPHGVHHGAGELSRRHGQLVLPAGLKAVGRIATAALFAAALVMMIFDSN
jgi:hypothetical protein